MPIKRKTFFPTFILIFFALPLGGEVFRYKYQAGDKYRILSQVSQSVYINGQRVQDSEILNRIASQIVAADDQIGEIVASYQTSEKISAEKKVYTWEEEYESTFKRDQRGAYQIEARYFMPMARNIPLFPETDLQAGDQWRAEGFEAHDFRQIGVASPLIIPVQASYRYLGPEMIDSKLVDVFDIHYSITYQAPRALRQRYDPLRPVEISGFTSMKLYWNRQKGRPVFYRETFDLILTANNGRVIEFNGTASARVVEAEKMDKSGLIEDLEKSLEEAGVTDAEVEESELGVTITLQNIQFPPDSAELRTTEKAKLDKIAAILARFPGRDILIAGHTADFGSRESQMRLSRERAAAVGGYFLEKGSLKEDQIVTRGYGGEQPLADNQTEEGRKLNRRVQITVLEN